MIFDWLQKNKNSLVSTSKDLLLRITWIYHLAGWCPCKFFSEVVMSVLCLLVGILLCSAELFCDKLLTQQQLQQPLFLRLSFCHSLYSTCLLPFHSCLGMVCQLFFFPCLLCHILSYYLSSLFYPDLSYPILSYPRCFYIYSYFFAYTIASVFLSILSYPILCIPSCFFAYPISSYLFASLFA